MPCLSHSRRTDIELIAVIRSLRSRLGRKRHSFSWSQLELPETSTIPLEKKKKKSLIEMQEDGIISVSPGLMQENPEALTERRALHACMSEPGNG